MDEVPSGAGKHDAELLKLGVGHIAFSFDHDIKLITGFSFFSESGHIRFRLRKRIEERNPVAFRDMILNDAAIFTISWRLLLTILPLLLGSIAATAIIFMLPLVVAIMTTLLLRRLMISPGPTPTTMASFFISIPILPLSWSLHIPHT